MLQDGLTKRDLTCMELEAKLLEREELMIELAEKLISANQEKE